MTNEEHDILVSLMRQIKDELQKKHDALQDAILVGYIELMLNFCQRFYNRQFITRKLVNSDMLMKFDQLLRDYYEEKIQLTSGMPPCNTVPTSYACRPTISATLSRR